LYIFRGQDHAFYLFLQKEKKVHLSNQEVAQKAAMGKKEKGLGT